MLWEDLKECAAEFFETHKSRKIGFVIGLIAGAAILVFGFLNTLFAFCCGLIGLYIGAKFDNRDDLIDDTLRRLERFLPDRFKRW